ncbi:MAG TPA: hypothetical protein VLH79_04295 [Chthonomonadales bacterium]|nr:hypothetical protein [Chthonomonadales bacterium]
MQVWVSADSRRNVAGIITALERAAEASGEKDLRAFVIFINHLEQPAEEIGRELAAWGERNGWRRVSISFLPGPNARPVADYRVSLDVRVRNTVFLYREGTVRARLMNLRADERGLESLNTAITELLR